MSKRKGFTLIEIMIVIMIVSTIFLAMGINIRALQVEARMSKATADLKLLQLAMESYYKNYMYEFPPKSNYQKILLEAKPGLLSENLLDPFGHTTSSLYHYDLSPNEDFYVVYSLGTKRRGEVQVDDRGILFVSGNPLWISNGYLRD